MKFRTGVWVLLNCAAVAVLGWLGAALSAGAVDSTRETRVSVQAGRPDASGKQPVNVVIAINKDWYIYANPVKASVEELDRNAVTVEVKKNGTPVPVAIRYPAGQKYQDKFGVQCQIHEGSVTIPVTVVRAAGDTAPVELTVHVNACNKVSLVCLQRGHHRVMVE